MAMLNVSQLQNDKAERILPDGASRVLSYNLTCHDVNIWTNSFYNKDSINFYSEFCLFVCFREWGDIRGFIYPEPSPVTCRVRGKELENLSLGSPHWNHHKQNLLVLSYWISSSELTHPRARQHAHSRPSIFSWIQTSLICTRLT